MLSGNLGFLKYLPNLEKLSLADNLFSGQIPPSLKSFRNLLSLNISGNNLLQVPDGSNAISQLTELSNGPKRYSFPEIAPALAPGMDTNFSSARAPAPMTTALIDKRKKNEKKVGVQILGFLAGTLAGAVSGLVALVVFKILVFLIKRRNKDTSLAIFSPIIKKAEDLAFLESKEGIASLQVISRGGCGELYRAELLGSDGKVIAMKKVVQPPKDPAELKEEESKALEETCERI